MSNNKKRVFISYSRRDYINEDGSYIEGSIVQQVKSLLQASDISFWFDEEGIYTGAEFMGVIADAIDKADVFLFISTENSNSSPWVQKELACANELDKWIIPIKAVEKYPATISIWLSGKDHLDYYHNPECLASKLCDTIRRRLDEIDSEAAKRELYNEIVEENRLKEEERQLKMAIGQYALYLERLESELGDLKAQQERLAIDIALREKSIELLKLDKEKIDKKYQVVAEKLSTPKESSNGSDIEFDAPEVDLADVKTEEEAQVKTKGSEAVATPEAPSPAPSEVAATPAPNEAATSTASTPEPATTTAAAAPKRSAQEEINALMSMMSILNPKKQEADSGADSSSGGSN